MSFFKTHKNDLILILAILFVSVVIWAVNALTAVPGSEAVVTVNGRELMRLPLDEDGSFTVADGERSNTIVISDGAVHVASASCPDHVCIDRGAINMEGQTIVCLPNKLVISIAGGGDSGLDAVAGGS